MSGPLRPLAVVVDHVDGHGDGRAAALLVFCLHRHRVAAFRLEVVVDAREGAQLPAVLIKGERVRIPSGQAVGDGGVLRIGGADRAADVLGPGGVLVEAAGRRGLVEYRPPVCAGGPEARGGPTALPFVVVRPHLHLVAGVDLQVRNRGGGAGTVVRPGEEAAALAVLHVVVVDVGTGVDRLVPGHGQAGRGGRLDLGPGRGPRGFVDVGHVHGHVDAVGAGRRYRRLPASLRSGPGPRSRRRRRTGCAAARRRRRRSGPRRYRTGGRSGGVRPGSVAWTGCWMFRLAGVFSATVREVVAPSSKVGALF